jgi:hypothetical protein
VNANSMARFVVGAVLLTLGLVVGLWAGLWWAFIGGIVQTIDAAKSMPTDQLGIAYGVVRIMCAPVVGWGAAMLFLVPGYLMVNR